MSKAKLGDVISVDRFGYQHFGVYSGNNNVIHYNKAENGRGTVMETSMSDFLDGASTYKVCEHKSDVGESIMNVMMSRNPLGLTISLGKLAYSAYKELNAKSYSAEETVKRARSRIGETKYSLSTNNCEHFAEECKTGVKNSSQVNELANAIIRFFGRY